MTGNDYISNAAKAAGILASGEVLSGAEIADASVILQRMIDSWIAERLNIFTLVITEFALTVGKQVYTLGSGGDFNLARPARIERMGIVSFNNPAQPLELPLEMLNDDAWAAIPVKLISSALPQKVYDDGSFPLRNLSFWCIPSSQVSTRIYSWSPLSSFTDLTADVVFPPGYQDAIHYELATRLCIEWPGELGRLQLLEAARQKAVGKIKSLNTPSLEMQCDPAACGDSSKQIYNWLTDGPASR